MSDNDTTGFDRRSILKATGSLAALAGVSNVTAATPGREPGPKEDEILVGTADGVGVANARANVEEKIPEQAAVVHENNDLGYMAVKLPEGSAQAMSSTIQRLENQPGVEYAERNVTLEAFYEPNDPQFSQQYAPQQVRADQAWDTTMGSMDVTISVVDQGVQYDHEDLADRFGSDKGYDHVDNDGDPYPVDSSENHGTHVAGCAASTTDNGTGTAGIANCRLLSARALGSGGGGSLSDIADAIQWSADQGADIINMSLGGGGYTDTMANAINYAYDSGSLPIAAAGNDGGSVSYPAAYENCMAVSAVDQNEQLASFSNRGPEINVAAPGVDVLAPVPWDDYQQLSGTSMACPVASGVAALGKAAHPNDSVQDLWNRLEQTAVDIGLPEDHQGSGRVDALNIVEGGSGLQARFDVSPTSPDAGETATFDGSSSSADDGRYITSYDWDFGDGTTASGQTVDHSYDSQGDYTVELTVTDDAGQTDSTTQTVSVGGGGGGQCGDESTSASAQDYLYSGGSHSYTYQLQTADPCSATVTLEGPYDADFDLYLTLDGRTPSTWDYDEASTSYDSNEEITVELSGNEELGILVDSYSGSGYYTVSVDELGK